MPDSLSINMKTLLAVAGFVVLLTALWIVVTRALNELIIIAVAIIIAEGLRPLVTWLTRRGLHRFVAVAIVVMFVSAIIAVLAWIVVTPLLAQVASLIDYEPRLIAHVQAWIAQYQDLLRHNLQARQLLSEVPERISNVLSSKAALLVELPLAFVGSVLNIFLILLLTVFWLTVTSELSLFVLSFVPRPKRDYGRLVFDDLSAKTGGYLRGLVINMSVIGLISGLGVFFLGVSYSLLLGVVAGLTEAIPIVGPFLGGAVAVLVALLTIGWHKALLVTVLYVVIQQLEGNTLVPLVMNRAVNLHPMTIIIALMIGAALLGPVGAILSLPAAAVIKVLVLRLVAPAARSAADTAQT
jgi:predicted PurR-regulated permease PerM